MLHLVLYQPEIPPNTGNIIRLCANSGNQLHLIKPLGFAIDDKRLRRAGLDYHEFANVVIHDDFSHFLTHFDSPRIFACSTKGKKKHSDISYQDNDILLLGPETRGLPNDILFHEKTSAIIRIPMHSNSRSLNLSNAAAIVLYEAWRQLDYVATNP